MRFRWWIIGGVVSVLSVMVCWWWIVGGVGGLSLVDVGGVGRSCRWWSAVVDCRWWRIVRGVGGVDGVGGVGGVGGGLSVVLVVSVVDCGWIVLGVDCVGGGIVGVGRCLIFSGVAGG